MSKTKNELIEILRRHKIHINDDFNVIELGLDFQVVFHIDQNGVPWVFRFPRRPDVFIKAQYENELLKFLSTKNLPFKTPYFEIFDQDLIAYKKITDKVALHVNLDMSLEWGFDINKVPKNYLKSFAKALVSLHQCVDYKAIPSFLLKTQITDLKKAIQDKIDLVSRHFDISDKLLSRWTKWLNDDELWSKQTGLIHGDLYPGHMLINEDYKVTGIIDWTEAKISDISYDFTAHYKVFGISGLKKLIKEYKKSGGYTWKRMSEHIVELSSIEGLLVAEFAIQSKSEEYKVIAQKMLLSD